PLPGTQGALTSDAMAQAVAIIRQRVNGFGVSEAQVNTLGSNKIVVSVPGQNNARIVDQVGQTALLRFRPVLQSGGPEPTNGLPDLGQLTDGLGQDQNPGATASPSAKPKKKATVAPSPSSSGAADSGRATASALRSVDDPNASPSATSAPSAQPSKSAKPSASPTKTATDAAPSEEDISKALEAAIPQAVRDKYASLNCLDPAARQGGDQESPDAVVVACDKDGTAKYLLGPSAVQGTQVSSASAGLPQGAGVGAWLINMNFDGAGTKAFADLTKAVASLTPPANQIAIVLDGVVYSSPQVNGVIPDGRAVIEGNFTAQTAKDLANVLKYGALPLAFEKSTASTISATLGSDQLHGGLIAGAIGLILVVAYCIFFYRALGIAALLGLVIAAALSYEAVSLLGQGIGYRLSIAGIAGMIVAIGITADSFVVFFERLRDEIRNGRSARTAVEYGWKRAQRTILSANFVSLLAAGVLYFFSVAEVKGFAFTLGMATMIDVVVIFLFTKPLVAWLMRRPFFARGHPWSGVNQENLGVHRLRGTRTVGTRTVGTREA
ncbi:MAG TPA: protein translocase subunit SecD, partial [Sporichthya sp.]|nr:protein translocase subunit SecD [Sporichthya sp.]